MRKFVLVVSDKGEVWSKLRLFKLDADLLLVANLLAGDTALQALVANHCQVGVVVIENPVKAALAVHLNLYRILVPQLPIVTVGVERDAALYLKNGATFAVTPKRLSRHLMDRILKFKR